MTLGLEIGKHLPKRIRERLQVFRKEGLRKRWWLILAILQKASVWRLGADLDEGRSCTRPPLRNRMQLILESEVFSSVFSTWNALTRESNLAKE
jgi:hypothetical protein